MPCALEAKWLTRVLVLHREVAVELVPFELLAGLTLSFAFGDLDLPLSVLKEGLDQYGDSGSMKTRRIIGDTSAAQLHFARMIAPDQPFRK